MAKITKKAMKAKRTPSMSIEDIKKVVDSAIRQNPLVFSRLAEI